MAETPETRYARSGDVHIAYQVTGAGPLDLVFVPGFVSHVENAWEAPLVARFLDRLGAFARLIRFDKRGTGMSDSAAGIATLEERMDDVRAVMDAVGCERAALLGLSEGGPMCMLFAATYPERVSALAMYGTFARLAWAPDLPWGRTAEERRLRLEKLVQGWGTGIAVDGYVPSMAGNDQFRKLWSAYERTGASPGAVRDLLEMNYEIDTRQVLSSIRVPTLVIHRTGDRVVNVENGRDIAGRIQGARYVELEGIDHWPFLDADRILDELEEFFTGVRGAPDPDRVLATVLFTDIIGSTERAAALGDRRWRDLLAEHHRLVRRALERFRGREIDTAGDGFLATFDGPARAIRCARTVGDAVRALDIRIRAGLHTGECEMLGDKVTGIAVHIAARIAALAGADEVLVSSTVRDLVAGSGLGFDDRGSHALKGVPGEWRVFAVAPERR
ncbi:MAG: adenylate/guanylate cyclase domain-containing protein [Candidatus Limnocylindria bacterium]